MPYVQIPKDLAKIKTKVALNLTKRQVICFSIAGATGVPAYFLTRGSIGNMGAMLLLIAVAMPSFLVAMYEKNGLPFEAVMKTVIKSRFLRPKIRPYKTENLYEYAEKQYDLNKEVRKIGTEDK